LQQLACLLAAAGCPCCHCTINSLPVQVALSLQLLWLLLLLQLCEMVRWLRLRLLLLLWRGVFGRACAGQVLQELLGFLLHNVQIQQALVINRPVATLAIART
jgi:hypothetical protein